MDRKPKFEISQKFLLTMLTLFCVVLIGVSFFTDVLTGPVQNALSYVIVPLQKGINGVGLWMTEKSDDFATMEKLREENEKLKEEIAQLKEKNLILVQEQIELNNLRKLYELDEKIPGYTKVAARVIGKNSNNWFSTFTIDKGKKDGLAIDMNVICGNGLVGIIIDVTDNYSIVRSIIDDSSNVTGMLITTSDTCNIKGDLSLIGTGVIHLEYLRNDVSVLDGEMIVTSNISEKYLEGILIGYAKGVTEDANSLTQSGYLIPAVDFEHMTEVLVITELKKNADK